MSDTRERMQLAFEQFYADNPMPNQPENAMEFKRAIRWAKDCFNEGYIAGLEHASAAVSDVRAEAARIQQQDLPT